MIVINCKIYDYALNNLEKSGIMIMIKQADSKQHALGKEDLNDIYADA